MLAMSRIVGKRLTYAEVFERTLLMTLYGASMRRSEGLFPDSCRIAGFF
jgi:hypothetical protein